jgi:hypothetical protein
MSDHTAKRKRKRKDRTTEVRTDKKDPNKIRGEAPKQRMGPEVVQMYQRSTTQDKGPRRTKRKRQVPRGNTKHKKDLRRERYASPARVARRYAEKGVPSTGDELEPCGPAAMFAMEDLLEEDY